jgi:hypothetical protein
VRSVRVEAKPGRPLDLYDPGIMDLDGELAEADAAELTQYFGFSSAEYLFPDNLLGIGQVRGDGLGHVLLPKSVLPAMGGCPRRSGGNDRLQGLRCLAVEPADVTMATL